MRKFAFALAILGMFTVPNSSFAAQTITVSGSTTVLPIMQKEVEAYMKKNPSITITVSAAGSSTGIKALLDGTTDIAMSSRELKSSEEKTAVEKSMKVESIAIATDAVLPIVHPSNPVKSLTREQLRGIFAGVIKNWKEVGGTDKSIVVISRDTSSGTYEVWNELVMKGEKVTPAALLSASSGAMLQTVSKNKYAIGYDSLGYLNKSVAGLKVDGVEGNTANASKGTFPISSKLWLMVSGKPQGAAAGLIDFILGKEGQAIVTQAGFVAIR